MSISRFINDDFENDIKNNVINKTYPNLIESQKKILLNYLIGLVQMIAICYGFYNDIPNFIIKLKQNSYKDMRWLLTYLLPYLNVNSSQLKNFDDLYTMQQNINQPKQEDINFASPKYVFSNLQYGRCDRTDDNYTNIKFDESHLRDNYYLLLNTIRTSRNKMYINWIDILPYRYDTYEETPLFINTKNNFNEKSHSLFDPIIDYPYDKIKNDDAINNSYKKLSGLDVEDIYNTISLDLYDSIIRYKWMIFDINTVNKNENIYLPLISLLFNMLPLNTICENIEWWELKDDQHAHFTERWNTLLTAYEKNYEITGDITLNANSIKTIVKSIIVFFDRKYSKIINMMKNEKGYIPIDQNKQLLFDNIDDYDEHMKNVNQQTILTTALSIKPMYIYDFIYECVQGFKLTLYSNHLMNEKKTAFLTRGALVENNGVQTTYKNVYNFCKSFVHEKKIIDNEDAIGKDIRYSHEYVRYPKTWCELDDNQQNNIIKRLNRDDPNFTWFNISRNMYHLFKMANIQGTRESLYPEIKERMKNIYLTILWYLPNILFEAMICKGILSYIAAENDLTDNIKYDFGDPNKKKLFVEKISSKRFYKGNPYGSNSFYYLTNKSYSQTGNYHLKLKGDDIKQYDYFDICSNVSTAWYISTTYHWIAQIGFCHRFINNRVNYITGGTGAGKSTQVPKMYIYYLKAIDNILDPTVVVTVPRTNVATGVSDFISKELSVPIKIYKKYDDEKEYNEIRSLTNYYVQYKHMRDEHIDDGFYPKIRFVTDGSVLQDVKDPLLKKKRFIDNQTVYLQNNKYDVVIIDEAHEHNTNMDLILSLTKNATFYNNKIRLVIMSATMDADEPIYRRFYRNINDNRKYPLSNWIKKHKLDRINTERRFHISSPDETTRFKIHEFYKPKVNSNNLVAKIINSSTSGDILLFKSGTFEINEAIEYLNSEGVMPNDVIALPYHAQLPDFCRNFIDKIHETLPSLRINKNINIANVNPASIDGLTTGNNYYKRCVLVATNIAEASISIPTLKFVVETGQEKTMVFDFEKRANVLRTNYITDASRLQRKGRVGRVSSGTVYYTYEEGQLKNNMKQFNIAVQDINQSVMLELLRDPNDIPIFTELINKIVTGHNLSNLILDEKNIINLIRSDYKSNNKFVESIIKIFINQYVIQNKLYDYYGNDKHYDYVNQKFPPKIYSSGFDIEQLTDKYGEFYIIHPDELKIKRNINGNIVESDNYEVLTTQISKNKKMMMSNKILVFWETLLNSCFIGVKIDTDNKVFYRTKLGELLRYCTSGLNMFKDGSLIKMLVFGYGLSKNDEEFEKIINIVTMLNLLSTTSFVKTIMNSRNIDLSLKSFEQKNANLKATNRKKYDIEFNKYKKIEEDDLKKTVYNNFKKDGFVKSDIQLISSICDFVDQEFKNKSFEYNFIKVAQNKSFMGISFNNEDGTVKINNKIIMKNTIKDITARKILLDHMIDENENNFTRFINDGISLKYATNGLNYQLIGKYVKMREMIRIAWNDLYLDISNKGDTKKMDITELRKILSQHRHYIDTKKIDLIKATLLLSKPYDIKRKIKGNTYVSMYNPNYNTFVTLAENQTFVDQPFVQEYILNMVENYEYNTIQIVSQITLTDLLLLANIYNPLIIDRRTKINVDDHMKQYLEKQYPNIPLIEKQPQLYDNNKIKRDWRNYNIPEHNMAVLGLPSTIEKIKQDIIEISKESKIFTLLEKIDTSYHDYRKILLQ